MKKITILFSALVLTAFGWQANAQYCAAGPSSTFDSNLDTLSLMGDAGSSLAFKACPGVAGVQDLTATLTVNVTAGSNYTADVLFGTCGGNYSGAGEAWIDWNQNSVFDASESIGTWTGTPPATNTPMTFTVPAGAINGSTVLRVMQRESGSLPLDPCGTYNWGSVTDFTVVVSGGFTIPCPAPNTLTATSILATSANLGWTENGTATTWDVEWGTAGFVQGAGTMVTGTTTNPHSLTGLTASTSYEFYVRADCGSTNGLSTWAGPFAFNTPCVAMTLPYTETFDGVAPALPTCWETNNAVEVTTTAGCTGSINESLQLNGVAGAYAYSPILDASGLDSLHVEYLYRAGNNSDCNNTPEANDSVKVDYWDGSAWINMMQYGGGGASPIVFTPELFNLTTGLTSGFYLRFEIISGSGAGFDNWNFDSLVVTGFSMTTGVNAIANNINLTVYPNPTTGLFTLAVNTTDVNELNIKVMNMQGQVVFAKNNFNNMANVKEQIDLSENANGIYFVTVTTDKGVITHKVVVQ